MLALDDPGVCSASVSLSSFFTLPAPIYFWGAMPLSDAYTYTPINPKNNEIRLLSVVSDEPYSAGFVCHLAAVSIDELPEYVALSYCWGDSSERLPIIIDE